MGVWHIGARAIGGVEPQLVSHTCRPKPLFGDVRVTILQCDYASGYSSFGSAHDVTVPLSLRHRQRYSASVSLTSTTPYVLELRVCPSCSTVHVFLSAPQPKSCRTYPGSPGPLGYGSWQYGWLGHRSQYGGFGQSPQNGEAGHALQSVRSLQSRTIGTQPTEVTCA